jgi:uncharacterized protein YjaG (DUF416 family)
MPTKTNSPIKKMSKSQMWDAGIGVASVGLGLLGVPPSITSMAGQAIKGQAYDPANEEGYVDPTVKKNVMNQYSENIEEILPNKDLVNKYGIPMSGKPIKALTQMQGTTAHNMSAKQYNKALQMRKISGAATMMTADQAKMVKALESDNIPENDIVAQNIKNK